jgi:transcriptional regulator with XRE-family HTH domain
MATDPERAFGRVLRKFRQSRGLSQEALGFESGYHRTYVGLLERGKKSPSLKAIFRLARALKVKPSQIVEGVEEFVGR